MAKLSYAWWQFNSCNIIKLKNPTHTHTHTQPWTFQRLKNTIPRLVVATTRNPSPKFDCVAFECCLLTIFQKNNLSLQQHVWCAILSWKIQLIWSRARDHLPSKSKAIGWCYYFVVDSKTLPLSSSVILKEVSIPQATKGSQGGLVGRPGISHLCSCIRRPQRKFFSVSGAWLWSLIRAPIPVMPSSSSLTFNT